MEFDVRTQQTSTGEPIEVAFGVEFADPAEIRFAIGCLNAVRLFIELDSPDMDQEVLDSMSENCTTAANKLTEMAGLGQEFSRRMLAQAVATTGHFRYRERVVANSVRIAVNLVQTVPEVRRYFPENETDLLTIFAPEQD
jgi:hypothetical protein